MKTYSKFVLFFVCLISHFFGVDKGGAKEAPKCFPWSFDLGGQFTWLSFSTPPTFSGMTGGAVGKVTYQRPETFFTQFRSVFNKGNLSSSTSSSKDLEWYLEFVGGYCFSLPSCWTITPNVGVGFEYLWDDKRAYSTFSAIDLTYRIYYALIGVALEHKWGKWAAGLQADCLPTFNETLCIGGLSGDAWKLTERVGAAVRLPIGYKFTDRIGLEAAPYYRFLPIGSSHVLGLPERNLQEWGLFITARFFL